MARDIRLLIQAINRVGIQNVSLLSRITGMPTETVRYTVKKRFPAMGLNVRTPMNHGMLGLERNFISLEFAEGSSTNAQSILQTLSSSAFLTYWCKSATESKYLTFFAVPVSLAEKHTLFLERLKKEGILESYKIDRLEWSRHPELKSKYYDFAKGAWSIDWESIKKENEAPPAIPNVEEPSARPEIDVIDTLIIKELQLDSWRNMAEIARKLKVNDRTLRWHYTKHVEPFAVSNYVQWAPVTKKGMSKAAGLVYEFEGLTKANLKELRYVFDNFPFTWFEAGRLDGYYQTHAAVPAEFLMDSLRYLNQSVSEVVEESKVWITDLSTAHPYSLPYENFSAQKGWFFDQPAVLEKLLPQRMKMNERLRA